MSFRYLLDSTAKTEYLEIQSKVYNKTLFAKIFTNF